MDAQKLSAILIVDDDGDVQRAARLALTRHVDTIEMVSSLEALAGKLQPEVYDAVLLDMNFATGDRTGRDGLNGLAQIAACDPALSVVLMTSYGAVSLAVEALKQGGADFILKPWRNEALVAAVLAAAARTKAARRDDSLDDIERAAIEKALARYDGNIAQAATALGLSRPALYRRMSKYGL